MRRPETKEFEGMAAGVFNLAYLKFGSYEAVAGKIGVTGHHVKAVRNWQPLGRLTGRCSRIFAVGCYQTRWWSWCLRLLQPELPQLR